MKPSIIALCVVAAGLTYGCAYVPTVGSKQADVPPKIVVDSKTGLNAWNDPGAFGPVPQELAAKGQATCATLDTKEVQYKAIGYHAKAQDINGKSFADGGYFCVSK